jgi:hypothetical protein
MPAGGAEPSRPIATPRVAAHAFAAGARPRGRSFTAANIDAAGRLSYGFRTMRLIGPPAFRNLGRGVF